MLLEHKNAIIYGGAGSIGSAVARTFAREGARVFLAGRTQASLDAVAAVRSTFLTWRAVARHMIRQGSGVILAFGGYGDPVRDYCIGGFQTALQGVESMRRQLASEIGRHGVRVVTLKTGGIPETIAADFGGLERVTEMLTSATLLGRTATLDDVGNVAAFVASDRSRTMTGSTVNISGGALIDV